MNRFLDLASRLYGFGWEARRRLYARGWMSQTAVGARVVSVGNITVGGTGKTTLVLHLAARARALNVRAAIVCRRYRPGPSGRGDEELMYRAAFGDAGVYAGARKRSLAAQAARDGVELILVDDGFSHWPLARDLDVVLVDAQDPWGGGRLLPAGRLREPLRALQRADVIVASRLDTQGDSEALLERIRAHAPGALLAAGRHLPDGYVDLDGAVVATPERAHVVTATGNPQAVFKSVAETGVEVVSHHAYRDHHWFTRDEAQSQWRRARDAGASLVLTAKDAVRWPAVAPRDGVRVIRVQWAWVHAAAAAEARVFGGSDRHGAA